VGLLQVHNLVFQGQKLLVGDLCGCPPSLLLLKALIGSGELLDLLVCLLEFLFQFSVHFLQVGLLVQ